jgi:hypothetical protein
LQETSVQTREMSAFLAWGINDDNTIPLVIHDLRTRYPGVQNGERANANSASPTTSHAT